MFRVNLNSQEMVRQGFKEWIYDDYRYIPPELWMISSTSHLKTKFDNHIHAQKKTFTCTEAVTLQIFYKFF